MKKIGGKELLYLGMKLVNIILVRVRNIYKKFLSDNEKKERVTKLRISSLNAQSKRKSC